MLYFSTMRRPREFDCISWLEEGQWTAHSPSVPGVYGLGRTRAAAEKDLADGLDDLFVYLEDIGERQPTPRRIAVGTVRA